MPFEDVVKGLKNNELFEGIIRISQKCSSEAYIPSPVKRKLCNFCNFSNHIIFYRINLRIF